MNAQEAREKARQIREQKENKEYTFVKRKIEEAVSKGELSVVIYEKISEVITLKLRKEGYTISSSTDTKDLSTVTYINW